MGKINQSKKEKNIKFIIVHIDVIEKYNISYDNYLIKVFEDNS